MPDKSPHDETSASTKSMWAQASRFSYLGIFFGVSIVVGWWGGHWIEGRWGGAPWVSLAGVLVGIAAGFRELFRLAQAYKRETASHE